MTLKKTPMILIEGSVHWLPLNWCEELPVCQASGLANLERPVDHDDSCEDENREVV